MVYFHWIFLISVHFHNKKVYIFAGGWAGAVMPICTVKAKSHRLTDRVAFMSPCPQQKQEEEREEEEEEDKEEEEEEEEKEKDLEEEKEKENDYP